MWKLKEDQPAFELVDGPGAGKSFRHGEVYADVPPGVEGRFDRMDAVAVVVRPKKKNEEMVTDAELTS